MAKKKDKKTCFVMVDLKASMIVEVESDNFVDAAKIVQDKADELNLFGKDAHDVTELQIEVKGSWEG